VPKCITCETTTPANNSRKWHCWKHYQCKICHYLGFGFAGTVTCIRTKDDFRRI